MVSILWTLHLLKVKKHCASELIFLLSSALLNLPAWILSALPHVLKSFLLGRHTAKTLWNWVPKKTDIQTSFSCTAPNGSKNCLLLLINSVSFQQESTLLLCLSLTHTLTRIHSQKLSDFQGMINRGTHCSGMLQSRPPASSRWWELEQSCSWKIQQRDQQEAWLQSRERKPVSAGQLIRYAHSHTPSWTSCRVSWHDSVTWDKQMHGWEITEENNCTLQRRIVWHFWIANCLFWEISLQHQKVLELKFDKVEEFYSLS